MSPKPDVSAERKQQIYEAALACFSRQGYFLTTMDDIAAECGMSKGALYWYFKSKKELFISLFEEMMGEFGQGWEAIINDEEKSATEKLVMSLDFFQSELQAIGPFFGIMMEAWAQTRHDEDVEKLVQEFYKPYLEIMAHIIEEGVANGEFQAASPTGTALAIMSLFDGITLALGMGVVDFDWQTLSEAAAELVLRGVGVEQGDGE